MKIMITNLGEEDVFVLRYTDAMDSDGIKGAAKRLPPKTLLVVEQIDTTVEVRREEVPTAATPSEEERDLAKAMARHLCETGSVRPETGA